MLGIEFSFVYNTKKLSDLDYMVATFPFFRANTWNIVIHPEKGRGLLYERNLICFERFFLHDIKIILLFILRLFLTLEDPKYSERGLLDFPVYPS